MTSRGTCPRVVLGLEYYITSYFLSVGVAMTSRGTCPWVVLGLGVLHHIILPVCRSCYDVLPGSSTVHGITGHVCL